MKKLIFIFLMPISLFGQTSYNSKDEIDGIIFKNKIDGKDTITLSVSAKKMPEYGYEFKPMLESLFHNMKCPTKMQGLDFVIGLSYANCGYRINYSDALDCLLTNTNDFIRNGYSFK
jgi:hypothetical protein